MWNIPKRDVHWSIEMQKFLSVLGLTAAVLFGAVVVNAADEAKKEKPAEEKFAAKCPISGGDAKKEQKSAYKDKEVYFCCEKCKAAFDAEPAKHAVKANHQLVQTKQYKQTKCPISGGELNKEQFTKVSGVKVSFCCEKCKGATEGVTGDEQLAKVFSDEAFKKGFVAKKDKKEDAEPAADPAK